jgi:hypothetical protein
MAKDSIGGSIRQDLTLEEKTVEGSIKVWEWGTKHLNPKCPHHRGMWLVKGPLILSLGNLLISKREITSSAGFHTSLLIGDRNKQNI